MAGILLFPLSLNKRPPYWNFASGCDFNPFVISMLCIGLPNFIWIGLSAMKIIWRHSDFKLARLSAVLDLAYDNGRPPAKCRLIDGPGSVLKVRLDRIYSFGTIAICRFWLQTAYSRLFPPNDVIVLRRKGLSLHGNTLWVINVTFDLGLWSRKPKGQDSHEVAKLLSLI